MARILPKTETLARALPHALPRSFVFMKVGQHAGEDFEAILARKRKEFERAGKIFWGYGGKVCNPITQVRPFVKGIMEAGGKVNLLMAPVHSRADPDLAPATEYSEDGITWRPIPNGVQVTGSRYAVILGEISAAEFEIPLSNYTVGIGPSAGKRADNYLKGRTDKACLSLPTPPGQLPAVDERALTAKIGFSAEILAPFAVVLR